MGVIEPYRLLGEVLKGASFGVYIIVWKIANVVKLKIGSILSTLRNSLKAAHFLPAPQNPDFVKKRIFTFSRNTLNGGV